MSDDLYKGLTAEQWHNAYQDLKRRVDFSNRKAILEGKLRGCYELNKQMSKHDGEMDLSVKKILDINRKQIEDIKTELFALNVIGEPPLKAPPELKKKLYERYGNV